MSIKRVIPSAAAVLVAAALGTVAPSGAGAARAACTGTGPVRCDNATVLPIRGIGASFQNPCWSPASNQLVFTQFTQRYNVGHSIARITSYPGGQLGAVVSPNPPSDAVNEPGSCWSAAKNLIAYSGDLGGSLASDQLIVVRPDGTHSQFVTRFVQGKLSAWEPSFSPSGNWLVFEGHPCPCVDSNPNYQQGSIYKIALNGTGLTRLTCPSSRLADQEPNWAPTNTNLIVFQRNTLDAAGSVISTDLYTMNPGGSESCRPGTPNPRAMIPMTVRTATAGNSSDASFSPDSSQLVYSGSTASMSGSEAAIFLLDVNRDAPAQQVTHTRGIYDNAPSYSRAGTIAFESCPPHPTLQTCPANSDMSPGSRIWTIQAP